MPPGTTAPGLPTSVSSRVITSGPWWTPAGERHGRRPRREGDAARGQRGSAAAAATAGGARGGRARRRPRRTRAAATGRRRARAPGRAATRRRRTRAPAPSGARCRRGPASAITSAELERAERQRDPARLVVERRGRRATTSSATPTPTISAASSTGHQRCSAEREDAGDDQRRERREQPRVEPAPQRVRHALHPRAGSRAPRTSRRPACRRPGTPTAPRRRRARACARRRSAPGTVQSGASTIQSPWVSSPCSATSRASSGSCAEPAPEAGRADHLLGAVHLRRDAEALARRARAARPTRGRADRRARAASARIAARSGGAVAWNARQPAAREQRPRHVERPPHRLAPPHRGDARAGGERVQPLGRRRHPGADDGDVVGVLVRLVGVDGARVAGELLRDVQPGMPGGDEDVPERRRRRRARSRRRPRGSARRGFGTTAVVPADPARAAPRRARGTPRRVGW